MAPNWRSWHAHFRLIISGICNTYVHPYICTPLSDTHSRPRVSFRKAILPTHPLTNQLGNGSDPIDSFIRTYVGRTYSSLFYITFLTASRTPNAGDNSRKYGTASCKNVKGETLHSRLKSVIT